MVFCCSQDKEETSHAHTVLHVVDPTCIIHSLSRHDTLPALCPSATLAFLEVPLSCALSGYRAFIRAICCSLCIRQLLDVRTIGKWNRHCLCSHRIQSPTSELTLSQGNTSMELKYKMCSIMTRAIAKFHQRPEVSMLDSVCDKGSI